jgi:hypothetical protein
MKKNNVIKEFSNNGKVFAELLAATDAMEILYRPAPEKWNLLEIACHLLDEERLDFRARMKHVMDNPDREMEPIDPQGWVNSHKYSERDYETVVKDFLNERISSVQWFDTISEEDLEKKMEHKVFGTVTVKHFLLNLLAHDYLHIRQIVALKYSFLKNNTGADLRYAGDW